MATTITYDIKVNTKSINDLESELADVNSQLKKMAIGSEEFNQATIKAQGLTHQLEKVQGAVKGINFEQKLQGFQGAIELVGGSVAATVGSLALFGVESERIAEIEVKVQGAIAVAMGLREAAEGAVKLAQLARLASTTALTTAETANTTATNANTTAATSNAAAWLKNPYVLVAAAAVALGVAIYKLTQSTEDNRETVAKNIAAYEQLGFELDRASQRLEILGGTPAQKSRIEIDKLGNNVKILKEELKLLTAGSEDYTAKQKEILEAERALNLETEKSVLNRQAYISELRDYVNLSTSELSAKRATAEIDATIADLQREQANEQFTLSTQRERLLKSTTQAEKDYYQTAINESQTALNQIEGDLDIATKARRKAANEAVKSERDAAKEAAKARQENLQNLKNSLRNIQTANENFGVNEFQRRRAELQNRQNQDLEELNSKLKTYKEGSDEYEAQQQLITETNENYSKERIQIAQDEADAIEEYQFQATQAILEAQGTWVADFRIGYLQISKQYDDLIEQGQELGVSTSGLVSAKALALQKYSEDQLKQFKLEFQSLIAETNALALFFEDLDNRRQATNRDAIRNSELYLQYKERELYFAEKEVEKAQQIEKAEKALAEARNRQQIALAAQQAGAFFGQKGFTQAVDETTKEVADLEAALKRLKETGGEASAEAAEEYKRFFATVRGSNQLLKKAGLGGETNLGIDKLFGVTAETEAEKEVLRNAIQEIVDVYLQASEQIQGAFTAISGLGITDSENRIAALEQEAELAKGNATLYQQIQEQIAAESIKLEKKRQRQAITNVIIDAAQAGVAAYSSSLSLPQPAAGIVLGATLAAIAAQAALSIKQIKSASETDGNYTANISAGGGGGGGMGPAFGTVAPDVYTEAPVFQTYVLSGDVTSALYADARIRARRVL